MRNASTTTPNFKPHYETSLSQQRNQCSNLLDETDQTRDATTYTSGRNHPIPRTQKQCRTHLPRHENSNHITKLPTHGVETNAATSRTKTDQTRTEQVQHTRNHACETHRARRSTNPPDPLYRRTVEIDKQPRIQNSNSKKPQKGKKRAGNGGRRSYQNAPSHLISS